MEWWRWAAGAVQLVLLLVLVLLWFDTLRDRRGWNSRRAMRSAAILSPIVPIGVAAVLLTPLWIGLILIAIPALVVLVLALAS